MLRALQNQRRKSADAGFTLIELLIVIIILGILAAIVVFSVNGITDKGNTAACNATVSTIDTAAEAAVAQSQNTATPITDASALTLTQLKDFFHNGIVPTSAGSHALTGATTVGTVDGLTC